MERLLIKWSVVVLVDADVMVRSMKIQLYFSNSNQQQTAAKNEYPAQRVPPGTIKTTILIVFVNYDEEPEVRF